MKIISNYIFKQIASSFLYITFFLIILMWLMLSLRFIEYVTSNGLNLIDFISMTSLLLPTLIPFLTPLTLSLACTFTYHKLSSDNELTVIKSSGISKFNIFKPAILMAILITMLNLFLNLYLGPLSKQTFKENQKDLRENIARIAFKEGSFSKIFEDITIYVEQIIDENNFSRIFVYDQRNKKNPSTYIADKAELLQDQNVNKVILKDGNRQFINQKDSQLNIISFDKYEINLDVLMSKQKEDRIKEPEEMYLNELWDSKNITSGRYDDNQIKSLRIEGHKRIINPIYCLIFTFITLTILLSDKFILISTPKKISLILISIFVIELFYLGLPNYLIKNIQLIFLIYLIPTFLIILLCLLNLTKRYKT